MIKTIEITHDNGDITCYTAKIDILKTPKWLKEFNSNLVGIIYSSDLRRDIDDELYNYDRKKGT